MQRRLTNKQSKHHELTKAAGTITLQARDERRNGAQNMQRFNENGYFLSFCLCDSQVQCNSFLNQGFGFSHARSFLFLYEKKYQDNFFLTLICPEILLREALESGK